jgi:TonB-dependent starch-binding outer membrane protein SusC
MKLFTSFFLFAAILFTLSCSTSQGAASSNVESDNTTLTLVDRLYRTSGVQVRGNTQDLKVTIRGNSSITAGTEPLLVINGIPFNGSIADANKYLVPAKIGRITVLKDPSEVGIYGVRGANGVIEVEIKD